MAERVGLARRAGTVARWPLGMALTSWRYLWRVTALHREDVDVDEPPEEPPIPAHLADERLQRSADGHGPAFHRTYRVHISDADLSAADLIAELQTSHNGSAPVEVAVFRKTRGEEDNLAAGDEFVVRMPGPWDGPVRVVDVTPTSFRLATLTGHMEAGQIEFRARDSDERLAFEIEAWTTSGNRLSEVLYSRVRLIKEMQLHMWTHYCEHAAQLAGSRPADGVWIRTERFPRR